MWNSTLPQTYVCCSCSSGSERCSCGWARPPPPPDSSNMCQERGRQHWTPAGASWCNYRVAIWIYKFPHSQCGVLLLFRYMLVASWTPIRLFRACEAPQSLVGLDSPFLITSVSSLLVYYYSNLPTSNILVYFHSVSDLSPLFRPLLPVSFYIIK